MVLSDTDSTPYNIYVISTLLIVYLTSFLFFKIRSTGSNIYEIVIYTILITPLKFDGFQKLIEKYLDVIGIFSSLLFFIFIAIYFLELVNLLETKELLHVYCLIIMLLFIALTDIYIIYQFLLKLKSPGIKKLMFIILFILLIAFLIYLILKTKLKIIRIILIILLILFLLFILYLLIPCFKAFGTSLKKCFSPSRRNNGNDRRQNSI